MGQVYREFLKRAIEVSFTNKTKAELVKSIFDTNVGKITKVKIKEQLPNVSEVTIERSLHNLVKTGYIKKIGDKKKTYYVKG
jgi:predicted HTH transcriptional regulator